MQERGVNDVSKAMKLLGTSMAFFGTDSDSRADVLGRLAQDCD